MHETHFVLGEFWKNKFEQEMARHHISGAVKADKLYEWMDQPKVMGSRPACGSFIVFTFAGARLQRQVVVNSTVLRALHPDLSRGRSPLRGTPRGQTWKLAWDRVKLLDKTLYTMHCTAPNLQALSDRLDSGKPHAAALEVLPGNSANFARL